MINIDVQTALKPEAPEPLLEPYVTLVTEKYDFYFKVMHFSD